jgi:hypothetical protein
VPRKIRVKKSVKTDRRAGPFTTGEVSRMLKVAPRTVSRWCDEGLIDGVYRIPARVGSPYKGDRRITNAGLRKFCVRYGVSVPTDLTWLCVGKDLGKVEGFEVEKGPENSFDLGATLTKGTYHAVILDSSAITLSECVAAAKGVNRSSHGFTVVVLILTEDFSDMTRWEDVQHFDLVFSHSAPAEEVKREVSSFVKLANPNRRKTCPTEMNGGETAPSNSAPESSAYSETCTGIGT